MGLPEPVFTQLTHQHRLLPLYIDQLAEIELDHPIIGGKWSIHEQIAHLACYQPRFIQRMETILSGAQPFFPRYRAEEDPEFLRYTQTPVDSLILELNLTRQKIIERLTALDPVQWALKGIHGTYGRLDLLAWTEFFLLHEAHHLYAIFMLSRLALNDQDRGSSPH